MLFRSEEEDINYEEFLNNMIPKTRIVFELLKKYMKNVYCLNGVVEYLEPFLIYQSDFLHGVRPVTNGVRKCVTFWLESAIPDPTMRYYITEFNKIYQNLQDMAQRNKISDEDYQTLLALDHVRCGIVKRSIQLR